MAVLWIRPYLGPSDLLHPARGLPRMSHSSTHSTQGETIMKIRAVLATFVLAFAFTDAAVAQQGPTPYKRLGGYDAIAAVTDDFIGRLVGDAQFTRFSAGHSTDSLKRVRQLIVDQLCAATGGPCVYIGRDMKTTHAGLNITEKDWDASVKHLVASLDKFSVPAKEKDDTLAVVSTLKKDIVEKP
jgi:hemoglobin